MMRGGFSFSEEEIKHMESVEEYFPEMRQQLKPMWWRAYFDEQKRKQLSNEGGLDDVINAGVYGADMFGVVSAEWVRSDCTRIMYAQTKARVFNILETQFDEGTKLDAVKRAVEDVLSGVSDNIDNYLKKSLIEGCKITK